MTEKITSNQENRIADLVRDAVRALGFSKDEAQEIIKAGGTLQEQVKPILQKLAMVDQSFGPAVKDFKFTVPADYVHDTQLDTFAENVRKMKSTFHFQFGLTSKNFAEATNKLEPGKTYRVRIFPVLQRATSEDCMTFLQKQGVIFVGGQGLTLLQDQKADEFPVGKWTVSFDKKGALWEDTDGRFSERVPRVRRRSVGYWEFGLGSFGFHYNDDDCLLCVSDM